MKSLLACFLILSVTAFAHEAAPPSAFKAKLIGDQLMKIEEARREAVRTQDFAALSGIYAPDFRGVGGNGGALDREALFALFRRAPTGLTFTVAENRVEVFAGSAIHTGRLQGRTADGALASDARFVHVFAYREGRWVCVFGQSTAVAAPVGGR